MKKNSVKWFLLWVGVTLVGILLWPLDFVGNGKTLLCSILYGVTSLVMIVGACEGDVEFPEFPTFGSKNDEKV